MHVLNSINVCVTNNSSYMMTYEERRMKTSSFLHDDVAAH